MKKRNSKIVKATAESAEPSTYFQLATKLLGREPKKSPLVLPVINWKTNEVIEPARFVGNLSEEDDSRLSTKVALPFDQWNRLSESQRIPLMDAAIAVLHTDQTKRASVFELSLDARALAVFIEQPDWTKKRIAQHLDCNEKSLAPKRCPKLAAAIAAQKAPIDPGRRRIRGAKDADGNLDAYVQE